MDTLTLIKQAHQGDKVSRDRVLTENTALIDGHNRQDGKLDVK